MVIALLLLLAAGVVRMPVEQALTAELQEQQLLPRPLELGTMEKIDQTSAAVALGGLRTLVASFLNLRAFGFFTDRNWDEVEKTYGVIVGLAPHTEYYWESGHHHLAYNAASDYVLRTNEEMPALRRREAWRSAVTRGRDFLERGIRNNPEKWSLQAAMGMLLVNPHKYRAFRDNDATFEASAEAYRKADELPGAPEFVSRMRIYSLARVPSRKEQALQLARQAYAKGGRYLTPTLVTVLYVLEMQNDPTLDPVALGTRIFGSPEAAWKALGEHWMRAGEGYPMDRVAAAIQALDAVLGVKPEDSISRETPPDPASIENMFERP